VGLLISLPAAYLYYPLARRVTSPHPPIPQPNGFSLLFDRVQKLNWSSVSQQAWDDPSPEGFRAYVETQRSQIAACRAALDLPWQVPFYIISPDQNARGDQIDRNQEMRTAARAFRAQSRVDAADGQIDEALEGALAAVRLGAKLENGNLLIDTLVGWAIASTGHGRLLTLLPQLDAEQCRRAAQELDRCDRDREPLGTIIARDEAWEQESNGWLGRMIIISRSLAKTDGAADLLTNCEIGRKRTRTENALLRCELAVRAFLLTTGKLPESLDQLVPKYLSAVPGDPWDDGPLKYRRADDGYQLYSIYLDGHDDGGLKTPLDDMRSGKPGDAFADTLINDQ
jgi:hypothetical protein